MEGVYFTCISVYVCMIGRGVGGVFASVCVYCTDYLCSVTICDESWY